MNHNYYKLFLPILSLLLFTNPVLGQKKGDDSVQLQDKINVTASIQSVLDKQVDCWNQGKIECFTQYYADLPYSCIMGAEGPICGRQNITEVYKRSYPEGQMGTLSFRELQIWPLNEKVALCRGKFILSHPDKAESTGWFTLVFENLPEGWRIVADQTN